LRGRAHCSAVGSTGSSAPMWIGPLAPAVLATLRVSSCSAPSPPRHSACRPRLAPPLLQGAAEEPRHAPTLGRRMPPPQFHARRLHALTVGGLPALVQVARHRHLPPPLLAQPRQRLSGLHRCRTLVPLHADEPLPI
jgi:hypothetical protein